MAGIKHVLFVGTTKSLSSIDNNSLEQNYRQKLKISGHSDSNMSKAMPL